MLRSAVFFIILFGGAIMLVATVHFTRLVLRLWKQGKYAMLSRANGILILVVLIALAASYAFGAVDVFSRNLDALYLYMSVVFFIGGLVIWYFIHLLIQYVQRLEAQEDELRRLQSSSVESNADLLAEMEKLLQSLTWQRNLLQNLNEVCRLLMDAALPVFDETLERGMGLLARYMRADRMYIWKNKLQDGRLFCSQIYEWSEAVPPMQGSELTQNMDYDSFPFLRETLEQGQDINARLWELPQNFRAILEPQGVLSIMLTPVFDKGVFWGFVGFDNCTQERLFTPQEEQLLHSGAMILTEAIFLNQAERAKDCSDKATRTKNDFLSRVSHELRTPMTAVTGMTAKALKSRDPVVIHECLENINQAARQLFTLTHDVLDLDTLQKGSLSLHRTRFLLRDVTDRVYEMISLQAQEKQQIFQRYIAPDIPRAVLGDDMRFSQILLNLLSNSQKYTPAGGSLWLTVRQKSRTDNRAVLQFKVADTGIGIEPTAVESLFMPPTEDGGGPSRVGGLGLMITKSIVDAMDGSIEVDSLPGQGCCFTVTLPAILEAADTPEDTAPESAEPVFAGFTALLAEDIQINQEIVSSMLEDTGLLLEYAENGAIALELFEANPERYDLIYMDIQMPVMDGYEATKRLRALAHPRAAEVPVLAMTANAFAEDVARCLESGMNGHMAKPVDMTTMIEETAKYLRKK